MKKSNDASELIDLNDDETVDQRHEFRCRRILDVLRAEPAGLSQNEVVRRTAMKRQRAQETLLSLEDEGRITKSEGSRGAFVYRASDAEQANPSEPASERRAALVDPELHEHGAPLGYRLRGASTLLNKHGEPVLTWVKTAKVQDDPEAWIELFRQAVESSMPASAPPCVAPETSDKDLLTIYPMGDPHLGLLSWHAETGEDFDIAIAERNLCNAVDRLVGLAPPSEHALLIDLGDFMHADNLDAVTSRSGHHLDVDSRWSKVMRVGVLVMTRCIDRALEKHAQVHVIVEIGNHNDHSALMMSICLSHHYRNDPRVHIDTSPAPFHWFEFGKNLIGVHHGHTVKMDKLPGVMACDKAEAWGRTLYRYWYTGHIHSENKREFPGCLVESFRTLAAKDYWHTAHGYRSGRSMVCDVLHRNRGRIMRHEVGVEALPRNEVAR